jgi:protein-tyrosine phosphatase
MPLRRVDLPADTPGALWLASMPGRFERFDEFLADARRARVALVVCLTPLEEAARLAPDYLRAVRAGTLPFRWHHEPMADFGLAAQMECYQASVHEVARTLRAGEAALLHCAAGIGRTGTTAACVLKALGLPAGQALAAVRAAGSNPESALQSGLIERF